MKRSGKNKLAHSTYGTDHFVKPVFHNDKLEKEDYKSSGVKRKKIPGINNKFKFMIAIKLSAEDFKKYRHVFSKPNRKIQMRFVPARALKYKFKQIDEFIFTDTNEFFYVKLKEPSLTTFVRPKEFLPNFKSGFTILESYMIDNQFMIDKKYRSVGNGATLFIGGNTGKLGSEFKTSTLYCRD